MATVDTRQVARDLRAIIASSNAIKKQLHDALECMESNPYAFEKLDESPPSIASRSDVCLRKVKLINNKHDFRLIIAHWMFRSDEEREDHVDVLLAFPREDDYQIDWEWVERFLDKS